jgi:hypothetical protein
LPQHVFLSLKANHHQRQGKRSGRRGDVRAQPQRGTDQDERISGVERMPDKPVRARVCDCLGSLGLQTDFGYSEGICAKSDVLEHPAKSEGQ